MSTGTEHPDRDTFRRAVGAATRAPSIHNTQPWKWQIGADRLDLFADRSRQLAVVDPGGRALAVSCGAALLQARVALEAAGWHVETTRLPDSRNPDHLASLVVTGPAEVDRGVEQLAQIAEERRTDRRPFLDREIGNETVSSLVAAAAMEGCMLHRVRDHDDRITLIVAVGRADEVEAADPAYQAEMRRWSERAPDSSDGVPSVAVPESEPRRSDVPLRDFGIGHRPRSGASRPEQIERAALFVLATEADTAQDRLRAGEALAHVLLTATAAGLAASPYTQPLEVPGTARLLHRILGSLGVPQMVLRIGWPEPGATPPLTPRRAIEDVLVER